MSYPYFFIDTDSIEENKIKITGEDLNHLINVLRCRMGDTVYISDNTSCKYKTEIVDINRSEVTVFIKNKKKSQPLRPNPLNKIIGSRKKASIIALEVDPIDQGVWRGPTRPYSSTGHVQGVKGSDRIPLIFSPHPWPCKGVRGAATYQ